MPVPGLSSHSPVLLQYLLSLCLAAGFQLLCLEPHCDSVQHRLGVTSEMHSCLLPHRNHKSQQKKRASASFVKYTDWFHKQGQNYHLTVQKKSRVCCRWIGGSWRGKRLAEAAGGMPSTACSLPGAKGNAPGRFQLLDSYSAFWAPPLVAQKHPVWKISLHESAWMAGISVPGGMLCQVGSVGQDDVGAREALINCTWHSISSDIWTGRLKLKMSVWTTRWIQIWNTALQHDGSSFFSVRLSFLIRTTNGIKISSGLFIFYFFITAMVYMAFLRYIH